MLGIYAGEQLTILKVSRIIDLKVPVMNKKICVVMVTYNRFKYLKKLLEILNEIDEVTSIYVFDNNSSDETESYFTELVAEKVVYLKEYSCPYHQKRLYYFRNDNNVGGAGGFHNVIKNAMRHDFDYLWVMDDDVLPEKDCLKILMSGMDSTHRVCIPNRTDNNFTDTAVIKYSLRNPFKLSPAQRIKRVPCKDINQNMIDVQAMAFEGPLIDTEVIKKVGYPDIQYFILFDDSDYCRRLLQFTKVRLVKTAILHKQIIPSDQIEFGWKDYYSYRNCFVYDKKYGKNIFVKVLRPWLIMTYCSLHEGRKFGKKASKTIKIAYKDAINNKMGKTVEPGMLDEYIKETSN